MQCLPASNNMEITPCNVPAVRVFKLQTYSYEMSNSEEKIFFSEKFLDNRIAEGRIITYKTVSQHLSL